MIGTRFSWTRTTFIALAAMTVLFAIAVLTMPKTTPATRQNMLMLDLQAEADTELPLDNHSLLDNSRVTVQTTNGKDVEITDAQLVGDACVRIIEAITARDGAVIVTVHHRELKLPQDMQSVRDACHAPGNTVHLINDDKGTHINIEAAFADVFYPGIF